ncbi:hypothetical protein IQ06DRAFT_293292 [Phaeosphaeriaceae sp. SRC1lsM3a]|nr:hypothetical protein IQ06DRAFT_293292 [Stagonospora sp. SRC1lsM3a]
MKFAAATTVLFATLSLASPAPAAQPAEVAQPLAVAPREAAPAPYLEARVPKKPKTGSGGNKNTTDSAAIMMTPSRALQLGALGLGAMQVVRLW